jgi:hypothetical protein
MTFALAALAAASSGSGIIQTLLFILLLVICAVMIWWFGTWVLAKFGTPPVARTVWDGLFMLVGLIVLINFVLGLGGHSFIEW